MRATAADVLGWDPPQQHYTIPIRDGAASDVAAVAPPGQSIISSSAATDVGGSRSRLQIRDTQARRDESQRGRHHT
eukprot:6174898-Pleurochrysis_carterae.AAC.1